MAQHRSTVRVVDAAGNEMLRIGRYGNIDSGAPGSDPGEIGLQTPIAVSLSRRFLYIAEHRLARITRVKLDYTAGVELPVQVK